MARRSVEPSTMSLLGLVRHLAEIERGSFRVTMAGQDVPRLYCSETDRDGDFDGAVPDPQVVAEAWDAWRAEVDFAERFVAEAASLDITAGDPLNEHGSGGGRDLVARDARRNDPRVRPAPRSRRPVAGTDRRTHRPVAHWLEMVRSDLPLVDEVDGVARRADVALAIPLARARPGTAASRHRAASARGAGAARPRGPARSPGR